MNRYFSRESIKMANNMKKCLSLITREITTKTTMKHHFTPIRMAVTKGKQAENKCSWVCGETGPPVDCWWGYIMVQSLWNRKWRLLKKLNIELSYNPEIPLPGIYQTTESRNSRYQYTNVHSIMLTTAKKRRWPKCTSMDEQTKKLWHIYTMEHYSSIKRRNICHLWHGWTFRALCQMKSDKRQILYDLTYM